MAPRKQASLNARSWVVALVSLAHLTVQFAVLGSLQYVPSIPVLADGWPETLWVVVLPYLVGLVLRPKAWHDWRWLVTWTLLVTTYPLALPLVIGVSQTWWWVYLYRHFPAPEQSLSTRLRTAPRRFVSALRDVATTPHRMLHKLLQPGQLTATEPSGKSPAPGRKTR